MRATLIAILSLYASWSWAQCDNDNLYYADATPFSAGSTAVAYCIWGGEYYTVDVVSGETYTFSTCGGSWDTVITLYDEDGNYIDYNDDACSWQSELSWTSTLNGTIWVLIDEYGCDDYYGCGANLYVTWEGAGDPPPANDDCSGAEIIACGDVVNGNTDTATWDYVSGCWTSIGAPGLWYYFEGTGDFVSFILCESDYDTKINLYSDECDNLVCEMGNDDSCDSQSQISIATLEGIDYFILVQGYGGATGDFELEVTCEPYFSTLHQDCGGSMTICNDESFGGNADDHGDYQDLNATNNDCLTYEHQSQWFIFSPVTTGTIEFTLVPTGGIDYDFAIWGPYPADEIVCPPSEAPLRCSYSALYEPTGLVVGAGDTTEPPSGDAWVEAITVAETDLNMYYVMLIDNYTADNTAYSFDWDLTGVTLDCSFAFLPVELTEFDGTVYPDRNELRWTTATELNNSHFEIERSTNGLNWEVIGEVLGQGTTQEQTSYIYNDRTRPFGTAYYRLHQFDFNGENEYSPMIAFTHEADADILALYPNPGKGRFRMDIKMKFEQVVLISLMDLNGRPVWFGSYDLTEGVNQLQLDFTNMASGSYILDVSTAEQSIAEQRLIKKPK
ncbi:MAG: T9SS type A sorting domain-containing protein [Flavobacteriales bacterium]|nr:T9SS type A sorting domain-containing protein [Flavobacteriales bacterium]